MSLVVLQVDSLAERVEELKQDKKRLVDEYEAKLSKVPPSSGKHWVQHIVDKSFSPLPTNNSDIWGYISTRS